MCTGNVEESNQSKAAAPSLTSMPMVRPAQSGSHPHGATPAVAFDRRDTVDAVGERLGAPTHGFCGPVGISTRSVRIPTVRVRGSGRSGSPPPQPPRHRGAAPSSTRTDRPSPPSRRPGGRAAAGQFGTPLRATGEGGPWRTGSGVRGGPCELDRAPGRVGTPPRRPGGPATRWPETFDLSGEPYGKRLCEDVRAGTRPHRIPLTCSVPHDCVTWSPARGSSAAASPGRSPVARSARTRRPRRPTDRGEGEGSFGRSQHTLDGSLTAPETAVS
ncbi:UNVERIFIED_CONTAM: hypothetical protein RKD50_001831 [Streptomyces canus]